MANTRKVKVPIDPALVVGAHSDIQFLFTRASFTTNADELFDPSSGNRSKGYEQRWFDSLDNEIPREIVQFSEDSSTGSGDGLFEAWAKIPDVSSADPDPFVTIHYADRTLDDYAVTDTYGRNNTWSNAEYVTHDFVNDSTGNYGSATTIGSGGSNTTSPWGGFARNFNDSEARDINVTGIDISSNISVSVWAKMNGSDSYPRLMDIETSAGFVQIIADSNDTTASYVVASNTGSSSGNGEGNSGGGAGNWEKIFAEVAGITTDRTLRVDDAAYTASTTSWTAGAVDNHLGIAYRNDNANYFNGSLANFVMRLASKGANWADTEYNNQSNPGVFAQADAPEDILTYTLEQKAFRFFDDGTESGSSALAAQNTNINIAKETIFQIRVGAQLTGDPPAGSGKLQFRLVGDTTWSDG